MTEQKTDNELRLKRGSDILGYISRFSATEKAIFGVLVIAAGITAFIMASRVGGLFLTEVPKAGGELREGEIGLPRTINPVLAISDTDRDISALVYAGLVKYDNGKIVPDIAESWTVSPDGLTYDFILKPNVAFQDGSPLSTDDVAFTIEKIQDAALKSPRQSDWANTMVKEISPTEIQFILKQPYNGFLSNATVGILPKHIWGSVSDDQFIFSHYNIQPIAAGPYRIASINSDSGGIPTSYSLVPWKGYFGKSPYLSDIVFSFFSDQDSALDALNDGSIDSLASIDPTEAAKLASNSAEGYSVLSAPLPRIFGVFLNQSQAPVLADPIVRKALDMATDRNAIIKSVLDGYGVPDDGPVPESLADDLGISLEPATDTADTAGAIALLQKSGWKMGPSGVYEKKPTKPKTASTTLSFDIYTANSPDLIAVANILKSQWAAIGVSVGVQIFDQADLYQNIIRARKYDALLFGEQIGKDLDLYAFWDSSERNSPGLNVAMYANSTVDGVLDDIRKSTSTSTEIADYQKLDSLIRAAEPAIFLYSPDFIYAVPKAMKDISLSSVVVPSDRWSSIENWYIETEKVWDIFAENKN